MPNIKNSTKNGRDLLLNDSKTGALGGGLEYRTRLNLYPAHHNFAFWASGTINTTRRTLGMPLSSVQNLGGFPANTLTMQIASTSANDTLAGTGAQKITIRGLDLHWEELVVSNIEMNGQTPVNIGDFIRVNRIFVDDTGSTNSNEGDLYVSGSTDTFIGGIPQNNVYCAAIIGENSDTWGQHTVAAHRINYLVKGNHYHTATANDPILIEERYIGPNFTGGRTDYSSGALWYTGSSSYNFDGAGPVFATTDITWIATSATGAREGAVFYELMEIDDLQNFDNTFSFTQVRNVFG
jgi:hypothetical protein